MTESHNNPENHGIEISVKPAYLADQSHPGNNRYVFSYTITITNQGSENTKLISRYWHIVDGNGKVQEVQGVGVVGEQPHLIPGQSYTYTSGAILETDTGTMEGHYIMQRDDAASFQVEIPVFALVTPAKLH
jgi:ApaG protein